MALTGRVGVLGQRGVGSCPTLSIGHNAVYAPATKKHSSTALLSDRSHSRHGPAPGQRWQGCLLCLSSSTAQVHLAQPKYTLKDGCDTVAQVFHPPLIDISVVLRGEEPSPALIEQVCIECTNTGFLALSGHNISTHLTAAVMQSATHFFDMPLPAKERYIVGDMRVGRGWEVSPEHQLYMQRFAERMTPELQHQLAAGGAECSALEGILSERFCCGGPHSIDTDSDDTRHVNGESHGVHTADEYYSSELGSIFFAPDVWPTAGEVPEADTMRSGMQAFYSAAEEAAAAVLRLFATALEMPVDFFDDKIDRHCSNLQVAHYPSQLVSPGPDNVRKKAHVDSGTITLLVSQDWEEGSAWTPGDGGLQLMNANGQWQEVAVPPGALLLNLGSLMTRWTNGMWKSTLHRVTNPTNPAAARRRRLSIAFFHKVNYDALIEVLPTCCSIDGSNGLAPPRFAPTLAADLTRAGILRRSAHLPAAEASAAYHAELAATRAAA